MGLLSLSNLEICVKKAEFSDFKAKKVNSKPKGQIVSKFDLSLLNANKPMYFDRNIGEKGQLFVLCNKR